MLTFLSEKKTSIISLKGEKLVFVIYFITQKGSALYKI